jgi:CRISPR-associated protein Cst1
MQIQMSGHPFIDIALATLAAMVKKRTLAELTENDLRSCAERLKYWYSQHHAARNYISTVFTNSHFTQPSMSLEQREAYADRYLFAFLKDHAAQEGEPRCVFFPELAAVEKAYRQHIPLLNGESVINFSPMGRDGLPVSGLALLTIHALPFGCLKCGGRLLGFHRQSISQDDPDAERLNILFARDHYQQNLKVLSQLPADAKEKFPDFGGKPRMRYITQVLKAREELKERDVNLDYITGYYFTNYGTGADVRLIRLDHAVMTFVSRAQLDCATAWNRAVRLNWDKPPKGEQEPATDEERIAGARRNVLYDNLFELPGRAQAFLGNLKRAHDWPLIELFLEEVLFMDPKRIETYRRLGDLLADYALKFENQPQSFYYGFSRAKNYVALRSVIRSAAEKMYKIGTDGVLFTYDDFINAFEHPSERYSQWVLARDLISIRLLERLHEKGQINLSELPDDDVDIKTLTEEETT